MTPHGVVWEGVAARLDVGQRLRVKTQTKERSSFLLPPSCRIVLVIYEQLLTEETNMADIVKLSK